MRAPSPLETRAVLLLDHIVESQEVYDRLSASDLWTAAVEASGELSTTEKVWGKTKDQIYKLFRDLYRLPQLGPCGYQTKAKRPARGKTSGWRLEPKLGPSRVPRWTGRIGVLRDRNPSTWPTKSPTRRCAGIAKPNTLGTGGGSAAIQPSQPSLQS